ncbi:ephrin-B2-like [Tubulanus polymorphus]|uniref:ephrin-B2-like n=1 Tax=Tubulanus polymorphus TaxID=672921 RepID=UPI003DA6C2DE
MDMLPWLFLSLLVGYIGEFVAGIELPPIYWNSTNKMFESNNTDHVIHVNMGDKIDLICPSYYPGYNANNMEYYVIYQVPKQNYDDCNIFTPIKMMRIINCSRPQFRRRYTIIFSRYTAIPNTPEFRPGQSYYYITTSRGDLDGLENTYHGACKYLNMKMIFKVCCDENSQGGYDGGGQVKPVTRPRPVSSTSTQSTTTTTRRQQITTKKYIPPKTKEKDIIKDKNTNEVLTNNPSDAKRVSQGAATISSSIVTTVICASVTLITTTQMIIQRHLVTNR